MKNKLPRNDKHAYIIIDDKKCWEISPKLIKRLGTLIAKTFMPRAFSQYLFNTWQPKEWDSKFYFMVGMVGMATIQKILEIRSKSSQEKNDNIKHRRCDLEIVRQSLCSIGGVISLPTEELLFQISRNILAFKSVKSFIQFREGFWLYVDQ